MIGTYRARAVVLDIEGTTSPISFVRDQLFPFSRSRLRDLLREPSVEVAALIDEARLLADAPTATEADIADILVRWIDEDVKAPPLKALQAIIWESGFVNGQLVAEIYADVPPALTAWTRDGLRVHSYSSGAAAAQRLFYGHTRYGDLLSNFDRFFDTRNAGAKHEVDSYFKIAGALRLAPAGLLFVSDDPLEVQAARAAGWQAVRMQRSGNPAAGPAEEHRARDFTQLRLLPLAA